MHENADRWIPLFHQLVALLREVPKFKDYAAPLAFLEAVRGRGATFAEFYDPHAVDLHELALAAVMRERFGKRWNRTLWEVIR